MNDRPASCRDVKELIDLYVSEDLDHGQADAVRTHLGRCERCRREADGFRRQHEHLAALSSAQMPNQLSPFFWQGIQREILIGEGAEEPVRVASLRRRALRPALYGLAALVAAAVTVYAVSAFFVGAAPAPAAPAPGEIVRATPIQVDDTLPQDVPFVTDDSFAPAGVPEQKEIEL
jgi:anti-sigma factor RsiW